jgi:hypothetical protein
MFDLETIRSAVTVGAGVAELIGGVISHIRAGSAVDVRPRLDEIAAALPDLVHAVRHGTAAEDEAEPAERDEDDDPANADGAVDPEPEAETEAADGGPDAAAAAEAEDKAAADTAGDTTAAQDAQA